MEEHQNLPASKSGNEPSRSPKQTPADAPPENRDSEQFLDQFPQPVSKTIQMAMMGEFPMPDPIIEKINENHITKIIDNARNDIDHKHKIAASNRWFFIMYLLIVIGFFIFLVIYLLPSNKDILIDIIKCLVAFFGGLGGGYGLKSYFDKRNE